MIFFPLYSYAEDAGRVPSVITPFLPMHCSDSSLTLLVPLELSWVFCQFGWDGGAQREALEKRWELGSLEPAGRRAAQKAVEALTR